MEHMILTDDALLPAFHTHMRAEGWVYTGEHDRGHDILRVIHYVRDGQSVRWIENHLNGVRWLQMEPAQPPLHAVFPHFTEPELTNAVKSPAVQYDFFVALHRLACLVEPRGESPELLAGLRWLLTHTNAVARCVAVKIMLHLKWLAFVPLLEAQHDEETVHIILIAHTLETIKKRDTG